MESMTRQSMPSYNRRSLIKDVKNSSEIKPQSQKLKTKEQKKLKAEGLDVTLLKNKNFSTKNAKALKPKMLNTSLPSMQMKDWYRKWDNYKEGSGWGQGDNHKTQLAYLQTLVSDDIQTATNFYGLRTVANDIHEIKKYLNMAVMPLTLQRLEMLR